MGTDNFRLVGQGREGKEQGTERWESPHCLHSLHTFQVSCYPSLTNPMTNWQTPWSTVLLEKLIILQLVKKLFIFYKPESSLPCSHQPTTFPYPQSNKFSPWTQTYSSKIHFNIILYSMPWSSKQSPSFKFSNQTPT